ncbi:S9 family peptidase [bacterium]|nr:MAG: S9 family peptidase [bacterium]
MPDYPATARDDTVDDFHGVPVADPYRWLEQASAEATRAWAAAQNALAAEFLAAVGARGVLRDRLVRLIDRPHHEPPIKRAGRYFFTRNEGLQDQPALWVQTGATGTPRVLLDVGALSDDGTTALTGIGVSRDGAWLAYGLSERGSDWQTVRVRDVATGTDLPEVLRWCRFASLAWTPDGAGFYYNRHPEPATLLESDTSRHSQVYHHVRGTDQADDRLVYARPDAPDLGLHPIVTDDGRHLVLHVSRGTDVQNRVYVRPVDGDGDFIRLLDDADAAYHLIGSAGSELFFKTDLDAPFGRVIAIDVERPERAAWREVVPESAGTLHMARIVGGRVVVVRLDGMAHRLEVFGLDGRADGDVPLPGPGTITGLAGAAGDPELFIAFSSFLQPMDVFRVDVDTRSIAPWRAAAPTFDPAAFTTRTVAATSRDGTRVPVLVTHRKDLALDGDRPVLLTGYGGFNVSVLPQFNPMVLAWMMLGGVFGVATLRGGGEYGADWHAAGMLDRKQNVFDDFIAAAESLIAHGYTRPARLAIHGGSNGGLLVAACMLQRPDLYGAVLCSRPVTDMLRYHRFTVGRYWVGEYGNAEADPEHFAFMISYSPLHNVRDGVAYPPILVLTADTDDRVVPAHAYKFVAALQAARPGPRVALMRVETAAGHGLGTPTSKRIDEQADGLAFLVRVFGLDGAAGAGRPAAEGRTLPRTSPEGALS